VTLSALLPAFTIVLAYPLLAVLSPGLGTAQVLGVPLSLVILGGAIYPPIVLLGLWYVRRTERVERRFVELFRDRD
jgi:sorbitol-specific phosphotransferase system component IIBC